MKVKRFFKMLFTDPNSPEGLRMRAKRLIEEGVSPDHPYVSVLLKQALLKEGRESEFTKEPLTTEQVTKFLEEAK